MAMVAFAGTRRLAPRCCSQRSAPSRPAGRTVAGLPPPERWLSPCPRSLRRRSMRGPSRRPPSIWRTPSLRARIRRRGEVLGFACAACHRFRADEGTLIGPHLHGVFGRSAGTVPGFAYSPALTRSGLVWTPRSLEAWLADPAGFVAGTTMTFTGYRIGRGSARPHRLLASRHPVGGEASRTFTLRSTFGAQPPENARFVT